jgi:hypothetical protein
MSSGNGYGTADARLEFLLADDFFFAAHDDVSGKTRLSERAGGLGLAGALLAELVLFRKITVAQGQVVVLDRHPPSDALAHAVLDELVRERDARAVRDWMRYLGRNSYELVAQRLVLSGHVHTTQRRWRSPVYRPVDMNTAAWPITRLAQKLARREAVSLPDVVLGGLLATTGLDRYLRSEAGAEIHRYLEHLVGRLPPPLRALVAETEAALGDAVLHHRM